MISFFAFALSSSMPGGLIHFLIMFLVLVCVFAVVIIAVKWLLGLAGIAIPQPLLIILGIILFIVLLLVLLNYSGINF